MMTHSFDMYSKLKEISNDLRNNLEMVSEVATLRDASGGLKQAISKARSVKYCAP